MRKIPFAGIELTSQRVRGYMVPLSYRGAVLILIVDYNIIVVDSHIQRIVLATEETTVTQQVSHRPIKC